MTTSFSIFQTPQDVMAYIGDNEKIILPICKNIVLTLGKCLDPLEDYYVDYDMNQATVLGLYVKQYELFKSFIRACDGKDMSASILFIRVIYEAYIKMQYLIKNGESAQKEYRLCSYINRYKFYIAHKGEDNPVAEIAIKKFLLDIEQEDFIIDDIAGVYSKKQKSFGGKTFAQLVEEFDRKESYVGVYGYLSDTIHSDWGESRQLFLQYTGNSSFVYNPEKIEPIPPREVVFVAQFILESTSCFVNWLSTVGKKIKEVEEMETQLEEIQRVLSIIQINILNDYKTDKYLYE